MSKEGKHHYIPVFYLKQWAGADGLLCEYSRPYKHVKARRVHPDATGYIHGLYALPDVPPERAQAIESGLMQSVDSWAAKALILLLQAGATTGKMESRPGLGWSRFLYSLMSRTPEHLALMKKKLREVGPEVLKNIREDYLRLRTPDDPETFEEYKAQVATKPIDVPAARVLPYVINSKRMAKEITSMVWMTRTLLNAKRSLLTSDRPIVMTNGLA
jgi:hypothetical protein